MRKMKKFVSLALAGTLLLGTLAACGSGGDKPGDGEPNTNTDQTEFNVISGISALSSGYNDNPVLNSMMQQAGVKINWEVMSDSLGEQVNLRLQGGKDSLPDAVQAVGWSNFDLNRYEQFMPLYFRRWPVETKYDILKNKLELCNFTGCSPNAIRQDFWASIHLANMAAVAKAEADLAIQVSRADSGNKYTYQANTAQLIGTLKDRFIRACFLHDSRRHDHAIQNIIDEISRAVSPIRPNHTFCRNPWPRKAKFCFNRKSNM